MLLTHTSLVSVLFLRCFLHQCGLEAAARCTSWPWTETASWTGEGTAALVSVQDPAGFENGSAFEILTKRMHTNVNSFPSFIPALTHTVLLQRHIHKQFETNKHIHKQSLNPFQPTLLTVRFLSRPPDNILPWIIMKNHWWASNVNTSINLYCIYSCLDLLNLVDLCSVVIILFLIVKYVKNIPWWFCSRFWRRNYLPILYV